VDVRVADNPEASRYEVHADGELAGFTAYHAQLGRIAFTHTEIDERMEGHGLGSKLVASALDGARERGLAVLPYCPFVRGYLTRHPEYVELVPEDERARFGL